MGIEPTSEAWEASILPLYDARSVLLARRLYSNSTVAPTALPSHVARATQNVSYIDIRQPGPSGAALPFLPHLSSRKPSFSFICFGVSGCCSVGRSRAAAPSCAVCTSLP